MRNLKLSIGMIGYRNHALRLMNCIAQNGNCELAHVYHPSKHIDCPGGTNRLHDLFPCDAVFIASPNQTHSEYIETLLQHCRGYIFCEKPPAIRLSDVEKLSHLSLADKGRMYFNYNFRFGGLRRVLQNAEYAKALGELSFINIISTHGLAWKKEYANSWRANGKDALHAIAETRAIHYVDLLLLHFGPIRAYAYHPDRIAKTGTAYDTVHIALQFEHVAASIFASYASPLINEISIVGTDGVLNIHEDEITLRSPRDTFDGDGSFLAPPIIRRETIDHRNEYEHSLQQSVDFFVNHVREKKKIDTQYFDASLSSNRILLEMQEKK